MSHLTHENVFPSIMREKLRSVRLRQAGFSAARAIAIGISALMAAMIVSMVIDWAVTLFDTRVRILLTSCALLLGTATLLITGVRPIIAALGWTRAAGSVDERIPVLQERWRTVASFAESRHQPTNATAKAMLQQVTSEAVAMSTLVKPSKVVQSVNLRRPAIALATACAALTGFMLINLPQTSVLLQRFWSPTLNISATQLESVTGDIVVPRGQSIEIVTRMSGLQRSSAMMAMTMEQEVNPSDDLELKPVADQPGMLSVAVDVDESFKYRVQAGDGRTEWHSVTAIDFPMLSDIRLTVTPPKYVDEPATEKTLIPGRIRAVQGSQFELAMKPEQELKTLTLMLTLPAPSVEGDNADTDNAVTEAAARDTTEEPKTIQRSMLLTRGDDGWYHFETQLTEDFSLSPMLVSTHGLTNENPRVCRIEVIEDKAPVARIISPNEESAASPDETIEIKFEAHDDHGIATAELVVYDTETKEGEEPKILAIKQIPLGDQQLQKHVMGKMELNLKELGLEEGKSISYAVRVTDNRKLDMDPESNRNRLIATTQAPAKDQHQSDQKSADMSRKALAAGESPEKNEPTSDDNQTLAQGSDAQNSDSEKSAAITGDDQSKNGDPSDNNEKAPAANPLIADASDQQPSADQYEQMLKDSRDQQSRKALAAGKSPDKNNNDPNTAAKSGTPGDPQNPDDKDASSSMSRKALAAGESPDKNNNAPNNSPTADDPRDASGKESTLEPAASAMPLTDANADSKSEISNLKSESENPPNSSENNNAGNNNGGSDNTVKPQPSNQQPNDNKPDDNKPADQKTKTELAGSFNLPPSKIQMRGQRSDAGQQQETDRRKLKITGRLDALAERDKDQKQLENPVRTKVVQIDKMLEVIEGKLNALYRHQVADSLRGDGFKELDVNLGDVETFVAELSFDSQDSAFEFVGLQMVDISSNHVTPARDSVFVAIRKPDSGADVHAEEALHHVVSARELLLALLRKYDNVVQEQELAKKIDDAIKMYTVYVEGSQQLMREAAQNFDPLKLQRELAVVEVDQAYLDRLAEVTRMRRDMMSELAKILGDDPRLRSRYLDLIKRRRASLRSQLAELAARQDQSAQEVLGWLSVSENQRENYWLQVSDLRLDLPKELAKEAQQFSDRIEKQMPLVLDAAQGTAARTIELAKQMALDVRRCDFEVRELRKAGGEVSATSQLSLVASDLVYRIGELAASLDQLSFEEGTKEGVADYIRLRTAENRSLADRADAWSETAAAIEQKRYSGLANMDQEQIAIATEVLRMEMLNIEADLAGQFNEENPMPQEVTNLTQDLLRVMESVTFNQSSATFAFASDHIEPAAAQQELALKGFEEAGKILDQLRRKTIESLDKEEVQDPNIADLRDPTLDEFLASLEREPDIEAQLGIPNRPQNIRVLQETMQWAQNGAAMLGGSGEAARMRIQQMMKQQLNAEGGKEEKPDDKPQDLRAMTEEEKKQLAESKDMQQMLKDQMQKSMQELEERMQDSATTDEQRRQMQEMAQRMAQALEEMKGEQTPEQLWRRMVEADQTKAAMEALAKGETLPDDQWNKLMSTLDDGLGQVGGKTPPEDYRKAIEQYQDRIRQLKGGSGG